MKQGFLYDDKAISPVIGFALVLAVIVSTLGFVQTKFVPVWNAEVESEHFEGVYEDLTLFSSNVESAAISGIPRTSPVRLGLVYPKRGIFYNPKPALFGSVEAKQDVNVTIKYTTVFGTYNKTYPSSSLKYELPGNHPFLVYEHGIVIRDFSKFGRPNATGSPNTLIVEDDINIPLVVINGSGFSAVSVEPEILSLYPFELTEKKDYVEYLRYVNITMDTRYPDAWNQTLKKHKDWNSALQRVITSKTTAYVGGSNITGYKIYINTTAGKEIDLPDYEKQVKQAGRLYAGMALVKTTATLEAYRGAGEETMAMGSVWRDVPPPEEVSQIILTNITFDQTVSYSTANDLIAFKIVDIYGNYWFVEIYFKDGNKIDYIKGYTSSGSETNGTDISVTSATRIDLLNSVFAPPPKKGEYQVSGISTPNSLVSTYVGDKNYAIPGYSPLISYSLIIQ